MYIKGSNREKRVMSKEKYNQSNYQKAKDIEK